jgi:hypothetical protein
VAVAGDVVYVEAGGTIHAFDGAGCGDPSCTPVASITHGPTIVRFVVADGHLVVRSVGDISGYTVPGSGG